MIRFFDASALAKRYILERGTRTVRGLLRTEHRAICRLAQVEIVSALARRLREGDLSERTFERAVARLTADLPALHVVELTPALIETAAPLLRRHPLRATDALHLASALRLPRERDTPNEVVCYDGKLRHAAAAEGLRVLPLRLPAR